MFANKMIAVVAFVLASSGAHVSALPIDVQSKDLAADSYADALETAESALMPMMHTDNYEMIMPNSAMSMDLQNFDNFVDMPMKGSAEMDMNESQFVKRTQVRQPQSLTADERRIRSVLENGDPKHEREIQKHFVKGSTSPRANAEMWERFDYDAYLG